MLLWLVVIKTDVGGTVVVEGDDVTEVVSEGRLVVVTDVGGTVVVGGGDVIEVVVVAVVVVVGRVVVVVVGLEVVVDGFSDGSPNAKLKLPCGRQTTFKFKADIVKTLIIITFRYIFV